MNRRPLILAALLLAAFAINLDTTIVNVALPTLVRELHASNSQLQWIVDAYNLVFASFLLAAGSLSDRAGRKGTLLAGLALFGTASLAGGFASSSGELIAARCLMGLGAALVFPSTLSLISNVFTERAERARAIGLWGATAGMAIALGPIFGGWLLGRFSWSSIFFAMAPVALLAGLLVARFVPTSRDPSAPRADRPGLVLSHGCDGAARVHDHRGSRQRLGQRSARSRASPAPAPWRRASSPGSGEPREPMLDLELFRNPRFTAACAAVTVSFFTLFGFIFLMTQYFQFIKGYDPLSAGVHLLPVACSVGVASVLGTRAAVRFGTKLVVSAGLVLVSSFYLWVATASATTSYLTIALQMVVYGVGMGLTSAPATEAIMGAVPRAKAGVGSAVNDATRLLGGTLGVAVIGSVYASVYASQLAAKLPAPDAPPPGGAAEASVGRGARERRNGWPSRATGCSRACCTRARATPSSKGFAPAAWWRPAWPPPEPSWRPPGCPPSRCKPRPPAEAEARPERAMRRAAGRRRRHRLRPDVV